MAKAPSSFARVARGYHNLWKKCELTKRSEAVKIADRIIKVIDQYTPITKATGVPEWAIGILHYRESNLNFGTYLGNGQTLGRKTTIVPKGRGPFLGEGAFVRGAIDAIELQGFHQVKDWSAARFLYESERFNGFGYYMKGINSPYVWGGTNLQQRGKYVRDGVFDPNVMDTQLGSAAILKALCERSPEINAQVNKQAAPDPVEPKPDVPIIVTPPPIILPPVKPDLGPAIQNVTVAMEKLDTARKIMEAMQSGMTAAEIVEERNLTPKQPKGTGSMFTSDNVWMLVRYVLIGGGAFLAGKGYVTQEQVDTVVSQLPTIASGLASLGGVIWGLYVKFGTKSVPLATAERVDVPTVSSATGRVKA